MGGSGNQRCFLRNKNGLAAVRHTLPTLFGYLISRRLPLCGLPAASVAINAAFRGRALRLWCSLARRLALFHLFLLSGMLCSTCCICSSVAFPSDGSHTVAFSYGQKKVVCVCAGVTCVGVEHSASSFAA